MLKLFVRLLIYFITFSGTIMFIGVGIMKFMGAHTIYDMKLKYSQIMESIASSPIYSAALYFGSILFFFVVAILIIMVLIMLLKR